MVIELFCCIVRPLVAVILMLPASAAPALFAVMVAPDLVAFDSL